MRVSTVFSTNWLQDSKSRRRHYPLNSRCRATSVGCFNTGYIDCGLCWIYWCGKRTIRRFRKYQGFVHQWQRHILVISIEHERSSKAPQTMKGEGRICWIDQCTPWYCSSLATFDTAWFLDDCPAQRELTQEKRDYKPLLEMAAAAAMQSLLLDLTASCWHYCGGCNRIRERV